MKKLGLVFCVVALVFLSLGMANACGTRVIVLCDVNQDGNG